MFGESMEDRLPNPPHRIGDELDIMSFLRRVVLFRSLNQTKIALVDEVEERDVRVPIALGIGNHETEVRFHHFTNGVFITGLDARGQLDFLFVILTFAIYGIWVDYQISLQIAQFEERNGLGPVQDTSVITIILDVASYFTAFVTNFVTSAIQQDQINRVVEKLEARLTPDTGVPA